MGKLYPVVERQSQIKQVIHILGRRTKKNPCLIGELGLGKMTIVEGLVQNIANGDVRETIEGKKVHSVARNGVGLGSGFVDQTARVWLLNPMFMEFSKSKSRDKERGMDKDCDTDRDRD